MDKLNKRIKEMSILQASGLTCEGELNRLFLIRDAMVKKQEKKGEKK